MSQVSSDDLEVWAQRIRETVLQLGWTEATMLVLVTKSPDGEDLPEPTVMTVMASGDLGRNTDRALIIAARSLVERMGIIGAVSTAAVKGQNGEQAALVTLETPKCRKAWVALRRDKFGEFQPENWNAAPQFFGVFDLAN